LLSETQSEYPKGVFSSEEIILNHLSFTHFQALQYYFLMISFMKKLFLIVGYVALQCLSVQAQTIDPTGLKETEDEDEKGMETSCGGVERWGVKTLTDASAFSVNLTPVNSSVAALVALTAPTPYAGMPRTPPIETTTYSITCFITIKKEEADSDYHLVLSDGINTLIGEIPDPSCTTAASSGHVSEYMAAKAFTDAHIAHGNVSGISLPAVTVTGVGFLDPPHGQTGAAPNNFELHPILDIHFATTGINALSDDDVFTISPNPSSGNVTINFTERNEHLVIGVYNSLGQLVYHEKINDCPKDCIRQIDMRAFNNGIYLFKIYSNDRLYSKKVLLMH
jgi:hypothetical protein